MSSMTSPDVSFLELPLAQCHPSRTNRKRFDATKLAELAASIREKGVLQPILVREIAPTAKAPNARAFEIVAGERRWKAAAAAGLSTIPGIIRALTDDQVLEAQLIENLQREDVQPAIMPDLTPNPACARYSAWHRR